MNNIGRHVTLSDDVVVGDGVTIGNNVTAYPGVVIADGCRIFDGVVLGRPPMTAGNTTRPLRTPGRLTLGAGSIIGANAVLYAGTSIDAQVLIGDASGGFQSS